jgi:cobalamin biosynthesis Co2+ chelatase CbiK
MLKIEVKTTEINERSGTKNNRDWKIRNQEAYAHIQNRNGTAAPYPEKVLLPLDNGNANRAPQAPYAIGTYYLSDSSVYVGDFNALRLGNPVLLTEQEYKQQLQQLFGTFKAAA